MASDRKRKRNSNTEDETEQPPLKAQIVENEAESPETSKADGDRRQKKSERRKKRDVQSKHKSGPTLPASTKDKPGQDDLANGLDFVPLAQDGRSKIAKVKGRSPRSVRKEARQKKLDMSEEKIQSQKGGQDQNGGQGPEAATRFICFVGNLPFTVTTEQIAAHFSSLQPKSIRLSTDKKTGKCKGFAFLEFENYDKMKTCLKLFHHSVFNPEAEEKSDERPGQEEDSKPRGRKINVELTAGGGGSKSAGRKDKIKKKNKKLNKERARDWEKKQKIQGTGKGRQQGKRSDNPLPGASAEGGDHVTDNRGDIHPSRLSRVRG